MKKSKNKNLIYASKINVASSFSVAFVLFMSYRFVLFCSLIVLFVSPSSFSFYITLYNIIALMIVCYPVDGRFLYTGIIVSSYVVDVQPNLVQKYASH